MDPKSADKPDIQPQTMRREDEERKGAGFVSGLLSKLGLGGSAGAAGAGISGGLFATKAGVVAMVMVGASVAAGISILRSNAPSHKSSSGGGSVFSSTSGQPGADTASALNAEKIAASEASKGGASNSLDYFAKANPAPKTEGEAAPSDAKDASASGSVAASDASSEPAGQDSLAATRQTAATAAKPKLVKGQLGSTAGGGASAMARLDPQSGLSGGIGGGFQGTYKAPPKSAMSALAQGPRTRMAASSRMANPRLGTAAKQLAATKKVVSGNLRSASVSSPGSGLTYDGGAANVGSAGASAGGAGVGGAGVGEGAGVHSPGASVANDIKEVSPPPPKTKDNKNVTPYQNLIYAAMGAMALSLLLMYFAGKVGDAAKVDPDPISKAALAAKAQLLAGLAAIAGGAATVIGVILMREPYNQMMQGMMFTIMGGILTVKAALAAFDSTQADQAKAQMNADAKSLVTNDTGAFKCVNSEGLATYEKGTIQMGYGGSTTGTTGSAPAVSNNLNAGQLALNK
ncbi:MAG: hypothetical protein HY922_13350 [Elusimicrobia bacterium]|nr:hypothetical protein [Elusimicrobiota bacterium]